MGLQLGVFGSGTHIPLMGSHLADFQGTGAGWEMGQQHTQVGCRCLVSTVVWSAREGRTKHVYNLTALIHPLAQGREDAG